ncbi:MAG TPA: Ig-like domain-containing protein, partial [Vicinamibacterales bacterium]|nr:Ig-like domain-containing protein [Vicinamibacterales bacterium]
MPRSLRPFRVVVLALLVAVTVIKSGQASAPAIIFATRTYTDHIADDVGGRIIKALALDGVFPARQPDSGGPSEGGNVTATPHAADDAYSTAEDAPIVVAGGTSFPAKPSGIVGWWRAETNANDSVGANHGTLAGTPAFIAGRIGQAFSLNGVDQGVTVEHSALLSPHAGAAGKMSAEVWVNADSYPTDSNFQNQRAIVTKGGSGGWEYAIQLSGDTNTFSQRTVRVQFFLPDGSAPIYTALSTVEFPLHGWHHIAFTYEHGSFLKLYQDGVLVGSTPTTGQTTTAGTARFFIGRRGAGSTMFFDGAIDDVAIYNRVLSEAEVQALAQATTAAQPLGLLSNDADADGDTLTAAVIAPPTLGDVALSSDGSFIYTPHPNQFGVDTFTYRANDGASSSNVATATITINPVNDPPTFTLASSAVTVAPHAGTQSIANFATASAGPLESGQDPLTYTVTNTNNALFLQQPSLTAGSSSVLSFTPSGANGSATVTVTLQDGGGTAGGGIDTSAPQTFTITIQNSAPVIASSAGSITANEGSVATISGTYADPDAGQNVTITASKGTVSKSGTNSGTWTWSYQATDGPADSGPITMTANDGAGMTSSTSFTLVVVNVAPSLTQVNASVSVNEAQIASNSGTFLDPGIAEAVTLSASVGSVTAAPGAVTLASESFATNATISAGGTYGAFTLSAGTAAATGGTLRIDGGPSNVQFTRAGFTGDQTVSAMLRGNTNNGSWNLGMSFGGRRFIFHPGYPGGAFRIDHYAPGQIILVGNQTMNFTPSTTVAHRMTLTYSQSAHKVTVKIEDGTGISAPYIYVWTPDAGFNASAAVGLTTSSGGPAVVDDFLITQPGGPSTWNWSFTTGDGPAQSQTVTITAKDKDGGVGTTSFPLTVVNVAPTASATNNGPVTRGAPVTVTVTASDPAGASDPLRYEFDFDNDGIYEVGPQIGNTAQRSYTSLGSKTVAVRVTDGDGGATVATTVVSVINTAPVAVNAADSTNEDTAKTITLSASDADGDALTYTIVSGPTKGTVTGGTTKTRTYTPHANFFGSDSFTYKANDGLTDSNTATMTITVTGVNDAPVANAQSVSTNEDTAKAITLAGTDVDGDALRFSYSQPSHGTVTGTGPNVTYTPAANYAGSDSFTFTASDGADLVGGWTLNGASPVDVVGLHNGVIAGSPLLEPGVAGSSYRFDPSDGKDSVSLGSISLTGGFTVAAWVKLPSPGSTSDMEIVSQLWSGSAWQLMLRNRKVFFEVSGGAIVQNVGPDLGDGNWHHLVGVYTPGTITAFVDGVPVGTASGPASFSGNQTTAIGLRPGDYGAFNGWIDEVAIYSRAFSAGDITALRSSGLAGTSISGGLVSPPATVSITVNPVNDAPVITSAAPPTAIEDTPYTYAPTMSDADGPGQTWSLLATHTCGGTISAASGVFAFTPFGPVPPASCTVAIQVCDGGTPSLCASQTATVTIMAVNDAPVANSQSVTTNEDTAAAITLFAFDLDSGSLTYNVASGPTNGTLSGTGANRTYTPNAHFNGSDSFTFTASDGSLTSNTATVSITINAVNDAPTVNGQSLSTDEDTAKAITLTGADVEGDALTFVYAQPAHGTVSGTAPNLTYTPAPNYNGPDSFTFTADDGHAPLAPAASSRWDADGVSGTTAIDLAGSASGTLLNGVMIVAGRNGQAFRLNGTNQQIRVTDTTSLAADSWTVSMWARPTQNGSGIWGRSLTSQTTIGGAFYRNVVLKDGAFQALFTADPPPSSNSFMAGPSIALNTWYLVTLTYDAQSTLGARHTQGVLTLYLNGSQVAQTTTRLYANPNERFDIGGRNDQSGEFFAGDLDNVQVFNRALSSAEVSALAASLPTGTISITVAPVNDAPGFVKGANQTTGATAGSQSIAGWATGISAGPPDESGQSVSFVVTHDNPGLFSAQPAIAPNGT